MNRLQAGYKVIQVIDLIEAAKNPPLFLRKIESQNIKLEILIWSVSLPLGVMRFYLSAKTVIPASKLKPPPPRGTKTYCLFLYE